MPPWNCQQDNDFEALDVKTIMYPYHAFRLFMPDEFVDSVVQESIRYDHSKGFSHKAKSVDSDSFLCSVGTIHLNGYNPFLEKKMYYNESPDVG